MVKIMNWRKSSYSGSNSGNCVEVADESRRVLVRDSKNSADATLKFSADAWRKFADQVKRSLESEYSRHLPGGTLASCESLLCWED